MNIYFKFFIKVHTMGLTTVITDPTEKLTNSFTDSYIGLFLHNIYYWNGLGHGIIIFGILTLVAVYFLYKYKKVPITQTVLEESLKDMFNRLSIQYTDAIKCIEKRHIENIASIEKRHKENIEEITKLINISTELKIRQDQFGRDIKDILRAELRENVTPELQDMGTHIDKAAETMKTALNSITKPIEVLINASLAKINNESSKQQ